MYQESDMKAELPRDYDLLFVWFSCLALTRHNYEILRLGGIVSGGKDVVRGRVQHSFPRQVLHLIYYI